jgi:hypothetical protein
MRPFEELFLPFGDGCLRELQPLRQFSLRCLAAQYAEHDPHLLFGRPDGTPPHPWSSTDIAPVFLNRVQEILGHGELASAGATGTIGTSRPRINMDGLRFMSPPHRGWLDAALMSSPLWTPAVRLPALQIIMTLL